MVWGSASSQLYRSDTKTPQVRLEVIAGYLDTTQQHLCLPWLCLIHSITYEHETQTHNNTNFVNIMLAALYYELLSCLSLLVSV